MISAEMQQLIKERFGTLPEDVQRAILSVDLRNTLKNIADKYHLHIDQAGTLENETVFVMIGLEHPRNYIQNVVRELAIRADDAKQIATDVNEQIFRPIRESLKKIHGIGEGVPEVKSVEVTPEAAPKPERKDFFKTLQDKRTTVSAEKPFGGTPPSVTGPSAPSKAGITPVDTRKKALVPSTVEEAPRMVPLAVKPQEMPEKKKESIYPLSPVTAKEQISITIPKGGAPTAPDNLPLKEPAALLEKSPFERARAVIQETAEITDGFKEPVLGKTGMPAPAAADSSTLTKAEGTAPNKAETPLEAPMIYPRTIRMGTAAPVSSDARPRSEAEAPARGIVEEKLSAPFRMPKEERVEGATQPSGHPYESGDPYRELID